MTFQDAAELWLAYRAKLVEAKVLEASTHKQHGKIARLWIDELGEWPIEKVRKSHVELALARMSKTRGPVTQQHDMRILSQLFNWLIDEQLLDTKPRLPTVRVPNIEDDLPSDDDFVAAIKAVGETHERSLRFMMLTGLAPHECERLRPEDYDSKRKAIGVGMRQDFKIKTQARRRWIPLNGEARALVSYLPFPSMAATTKALQRARPNMPETAHKITPKMMRRWFGSKMAHECAEHVLQKLLGHAPGSPVTRKHYVRSNDDDTTKAVAGLHTPQGE